MSGTSAESKAAWRFASNYIDPVPPALRDRMEVIEILGYTDHFDLEIASRYLVLRQLQEHGLSAGQCRIKPAALTRIISDCSRTC